MDFGVNALKTSRQTPVPKRISEGQLIVRPISFGIVALGRNV